MSAHSHHCISISENISFDLEHLVISLVDSSTLNTLQCTLIDITARKLIDGAVGTRHIDIRQIDVGTNAGTAADDIAGDRAVFRAGLSVNVLHGDVGNGEFGGELIACREILLAICFLSVKKIGEGGDRAYSIE